MKVTVGLGPHRVRLMCSDGTEMDQYVDMDQFKNALSLGHHDTISFVTNSGQRYWDMKRGLISAWKEIVKKGDNQ